MRAIIAMDCDGTVSVSGGPIPVDLVVRLFAHPKNLLFIIGNPALQKFVPAIADQDGGKSAALARWKIVHPFMDRYVVVDDTPAQYDKGWAGWEFFSPAEFLKHADEFLSMNDETPTPTPSETPPPTTPETAPPSPFANEAEAFLKAKFAEFESRIAALEARLTAPGSVAVSPEPADPIPAETPEPAPTRLTAQGHPA